MGHSHYSLGNTTPQAVVGLLEATGSTDADVLFAAKTEYARTFNYQKVYGLLAMVGGAATSLGLRLAMVGIPLALVGSWYWRKGVRNLTIVEAGYEQFMSSTQGTRRRAARTRAEVARRSDVHEHDVLSPAFRTSRRPHDSSKGVVPSSEAP